MDETLPRIYNVKYRTRDGYHLFTSDEFPGMYIATKDPAKALSDIPIVVAELEKLGEGVKQ